VIREMGPPTATSDLGGMTYQSSRGTARLRAVGRLGFSWPAARGRAWSRWRIHGGRRGAFPGSIRRRLATTPRAFGGVRGFPDAAAVVHETFLSTPADILISAALET